MTSSYKHRPFGSPYRLSQSLGNDRCQNILYKAVFEHFNEIKTIAALLLGSKSFQNSSFGPNFLVNFVVDENTISLLESLLSSSSCLPMQFLPSIQIGQRWNRLEKIDRGMSNFVGELVKTKYFHASLRSLTLHAVTTDVLSLFFKSSTINTWPQLRDLELGNCTLAVTVLTRISKNAVQLRTVNLSQNPTITDAGLEHIANLSGITSLNLYGCSGIGDVGLEHVAKLNNITFLDLSHCSGITDACLEHIAKLANITSLGLRECKQITDAGLEHIVKLTNMTSLDLCKCRELTDAGLQHISNLPSITSLNLSECRRITGVGVEHVSKLSSIVDLNLSFCDNITDIGLEHIANLPNLAGLNLYGDDKITDEAKRKLKTALPKCEIHY